MKIAITTTSFAKYDMEAMNILFEKGVHCIQNARGRTLSGDEVIKLAKECDGIIAGTEPLSAAVMALCPQLKAISRVGVGLDNVDVDFAKERGISVSTTSADHLARAVSEYVLGLTLNLLRGMGQQDRDLRQGKWQKNMGFLLRGKKVGIVGFGRMGRAAAALLAVLGCDIAFADPNVSAEDGGRYAKMELEELLAYADIISLHCPAQSNGAVLLGEQELERMPKGAFLINTARGSLVDEKALYEALSSGHLGGAALDVYEKEPYEGDLTSLENIILSPHSASYAREARAHMEMEAVQNICRDLGLE